MSGNQEQPNQSMLEVPLRQFLENDQSLRLNRVAQMLNSTQITHNKNTWVSSVRREDDGTRSIAIGGQGLPPEVVTRWGWGTSDQNEQLLIKLSHELAHAFQAEKGFEGALVRFLNGENDFADNLLPYIELYAILSGVGPINGLTSESAYEQQNQQTGLLKMQTLEDITELIAAYIISDEYFVSRLENSLATLSQDQKNQIATKVIEVCRELH